MKRALEEAVIEGIETNKELHLKIIGHPDFRGNNYATTFLNSYLQ
jgi:acetyl-CoA carboxylase biotin carboxylase subunit